MWCGPWEGEKVTGREEASYKGKSMRKKTIYLWKLNAGQGGLGLARDEVRNGRIHSSDHFNVILLIFESLVTSIQL